MGMEACQGAHYRAREMREFRHDVRLMSPQFVTPYRQRHKNDPNDAAEDMGIGGVSELLISS